MTTSFSEPYLCRISCGSCSSPTARMWRSPRWGITSAAGLERTIVVTDAVAPAGMGPGRFRIGRWDLLIGDDLVARAPDGSHLVGSAVTMSQAVQRLIERVGLTRAEAQRLTIHNPRTA